nr:rod-binding protein [Sphingomonas sp. ID1715]
MLKSARAAKLDDGLFDSEALNQFQDMQDAKLSETMAVHTPMGIGKALTEFLARNRPDLKGGDK